MPDDTLRKRIVRALREEGLSAPDLDLDGGHAIDTTEEAVVSTVIAALTPATRGEVADCLGTVLTYHESYAIADALLARFPVVSRGDGGE